MTLCDEDRPTPDLYVNPDLYQRLFDDGLWGLVRRASTCRNTFYWSRPGVLRILQEASTHMKEQGLERPEGQKRARCPKVRYVWLWISLQYLYLTCILGNWGLHALAAGPSTPTSTLNGKLALRGGSRETDVYT